LCIATILRIGAVLTCCTMIAGALTTLRAAGRDAEAPRSTQRSGSSLQREPAFAAGTMTTAAATTSAS
jgi:hypothetical protein